MKYQMDLTYDLDEPEDAQAFTILQVTAALNGVDVTLVERKGPGGGWPVVGFHVTSELGAVWFARFVAEYDEGATPDDYLVGE